MTLSEIWIYPVKSLAGIAVKEAEVTQRGLRYDRRWMVVDHEGVFVTQRESPAFALIATALEHHFLLLWPKKDPIQTIHIPLLPQPHWPHITVQVWNDTVMALHIPEADHWLHQQFGQPYRLVYMPDDARRPVEAGYVAEECLVSFADGYPYLLIGQGALDDLNQRLPHPLPMNRFRPNLVVKGVAPFAEDQWTEVRIGDVVFGCVKPCARCIITTTDQETAQRSAEPLKTLATYRKKGNKILFGQNTVLRSPEGSFIKVGASVQVTTTS